MPGAYFGAVVSAPGFAVGETYGLYRGGDAQNGHRQVYHSRDSLAFGTATLPNRIAGALNDLEGFPASGRGFTISYELAERILDFYSQRGIDTGLTAEMLTRVRKTIEVEEMLTGLPPTEPSRAYYDITGEKGEPSGDFIPDGPVSYFVDIEDSAGDAGGD